MSEVLLIQRCQPTVLNLKKKTERQSFFPSVTPIDLKPAVRKTPVKKYYLVITLPNGFFACKIKPDTDLSYLKRLLGVLLSTGAYKANKIYPQQYLLADVI